MSSVCDEKGQWWYHCGRCNGTPGTQEYSPRGKWVKIEELCFLEPTEGLPFGLNVCSDCAVEASGKGEEVDLIPEIYTIDISQIPRTE